MFLHPPESSKTSCLVHTSKLRGSDLFRTTDVIKQHKVSLSQGKVGPSSSSQTLRGLLLPHFCPDTLAVPAAATAAVAAAAVVDKLTTGSRKDDPSARSKPSERASGKAPESMASDPKAIRHPDGPPGHGPSSAPDRFARVGSGLVSQPQTPSKPVPGSDAQKPQHGKRKATAAPGDDDTPDSPNAGHKERRGNKEKSKGKDKDKDKEKSQKEDKRDRHDREKDATKAADGKREDAQVKMEAGEARGSDRDASKDRDTTKDRVPKDATRDTLRDTVRDPPQDRDGKRGKDKDSRHHHPRSKSDTDMPGPAAAGAVEVARQAEQRGDRPVDAEGRRETRTSVKEEDMERQQRESKHGRLAPVAPDADPQARDRCVSTFD